MMFLFDYGDTRLLTVQLVGFSVAEPNEHTRGCSRKPESLLSNTPRLTRNRPWPPLLLLLSMRSRYAQQFLIERRQIAGTFRIASLVQFLTSQR